MNKKIFFVRHTYADNSHPDTEREITEEGKNAAELTFRYWSHIENNVDWIISSPLKRAVGTANLIKQAFDYKREIFIDQSLAPGSSLDNILQVSNALIEQKIVFVGHAPDLAFFVQKLLTKYTLRTHILPGTVICIDFSGKVSAGNGVLEYFLPCRLKTGN